MRVGRRLGHPPTPVNDTFRQLLGRGRGRLPDVARTVTAADGDQGYVRDDRDRGRPSSASNRVDLLRRFRTSGEIKNSPARRGCGRAVRRAEPGRGAHGASRGGASGRRAGGLVGSHWPSPAGHRWPSRDARTTPRGSRSGTVSRSICLSAVYSRAPRAFTAADAPPVKGEVGEHYYDRSERLHQPSP